jgi:OmpA-OmpF porin, OOP family
MRFIAVFFILVFGFSVLAQDKQESVPGVNLAFDEKSPVLSPDGKLLFFTVSHHPKNIGGVRDKGDIWFAEFDGFQWSTPVHAGSTLNNSDYNAVAGFSSDGQQIYLLSHYDPTGVAAKTQGISVSRRAANGWEQPENISIPYFLNKATYLSGSMSLDGSIFVYAAESYGSRVEDIYVTLKGADGKWSEPKNLGRKVNTQFQESSPWLAADGTTLYYSSNGRGSKSFDVFVTRRVDDSWFNWSEPESVSPVVNSEGRELFYRQYHEFSMYTSTKNSDVYGNIKIYRPDAPFSPATVATLVLQDTVVRQQELAEVNEPAFKVYGLITNAKTGQSVPGVIIFESADTSFRATALASGYSSPLVENKKYLVRIEAPGYISEVERLEAKSTEVKSIEMNFSLQPIEVGSTVTLDNVLFMQSKAELLPDSYPELNEIVAFLKSNPKVEVELSGHTDSRGSFRQLMTLSQQRVNRVKSYLVSKGIDSKRIVGKGYGGSKPVAGNDSEETRMLNRRVEFTIRKI